VHATFYIFIEQINIHKTKSLYFFLIQLNRTRTDWDQCGNCWCKWKWD